MTPDIAISEIKLILNSPIEAVKRIWVVDTVNEAIWSVLDRAEGAGLHILKQVGLTYSDIENN